MLEEHIEVILNSFSIADMLQLYSHQDIISKEMCLICSYW